MKSETFPELLKKTREGAKLTLRQLKDRLHHQKTPASITQLSFIETGRMKPTYSLGLNTALVLGIDVETALSSVYTSRIHWCIEKETESLREFVRERGLDLEGLDKIHIS